MRCMIAAMHESNINHKGGPFPLFTKLSLVKIFSWSNMAIRIDFRKMIRIKLGF